MKKAIIAMSGGVDSSVAAHIIKESGIETIGVILKLYTNEEIGTCREKTCCSLDDVEDARSVANRLDMPFYVFNFKDRFEEKVIKPFVETYKAGKTPNPCIDCNRFIKFEALFARAEEIGFDYVVTGHYAIIERDSKSGRYLLRKGKDNTKDQSYVLYSLTQNQLSRLLLPLGSYEKLEVRKMAEQNKFINARKRDSQDICFVPDGNYAKFIETYTGNEFPKGDFIGKDGKVFGEHKGIIHYTVGQRKGLGLSFPEPMYVCDIDPVRNLVVLGKHEELFKNELFANEINLISQDRIVGDMRVTAKVRYKHKEQPATVRQLGEDRIQVVFDEPQRAITKGQAVVLYIGELVLGGGVIT